MSDQLTHECGLAFIRFLSSLGFEVRIKGSHYIFYKEGVQEIINIQEIGSHSKAYLVKQIRK